MAGGMFSRPVQQPAAVIDMPSRPTQQGPRLRRQIDMMAIARQTAPAPTPTQASHPPQPAAPKTTQSSHPPQATGQTRLAPMTTSVETAVFAAPRMKVETAAWPTSADTTPIRVRMPSAGGRQPGISPGTRVTQPGISPGTRVTQPGISPGTRVSPTAQRGTRVTQMLDASTRPTSVTPQMSVVVPSSPDTTPIRVQMPSSSGGRYPMPSSGGGRYPMPRSGIAPGTRVAPTEIGPSTVVQQGRRYPTAEQPLTIGPTSRAATQLTVGPTSRVATLDASTPTSVTPKMSVQTATVPTTVRTQMPTTTRTQMPSGGGGTSVLRTRMPQRSSTTTTRFASGGGRTSTRSGQRFNVPQVQSPSQVIIQPPLQSWWGEPITYHPFHYFEYDCLPLVDVYAGVINICPWDERYPIAVAANADGTWSMPRVLALKGTGALTEDQKQVAAVSVGAGLLGAVLGVLVVKDRMVGGLVGGISGVLGGFVAARLLAGKESAA